jgi:hypothetical protein
MRIFDFTKTHVDIDIRHVIQTSITKGKRTNRCVNRSNYVQARTMKSGYVVCALMAVRSLHLSSRCIWRHE